MYQMPKKKCLEEGSLMKRNWWRYCILVIIAIITLLLLGINAIKKISGFWCIGIGDGIELFILIYVSYYLVQYQSKIMHKKEKVGELISKVQKKLMDPALVDVSSEDAKRITRVKISTISNLLEIVKDNIDNPKCMDAVISYMDALSGIVMDNLDDSDYIKKSHPQIVKHITDIDTRLEKIRFEESL